MSFSLLREDVILKQGNPSGPLSSMAAIHPSAFLCEQKQHSVLTRPCSDTSPSRTTEQIPPVLCKQLGPSYSLAGTDYRPHREARCGQGCRNVWFSKVSAVSEGSESRLGKTEERR